MSEDENESNIGPYEGLGRNPNSNIQQAKEYDGLGKNPNSKIGEAGDIGGLNAKRKLGVDLDIQYGPQKDANLPIIEIPALGLEAPASLLHFKISGVTYVEPDYTVTLRGGYFLIRSVVSGEDSMLLVIPKVDIDGTMTELPPNETAEISMMAGERLYLKVETDDMDQLKSAEEPETGFLVTIATAGEDEEGTQSQPIDDLNPSGTDGVYYYPIASLQIDEDDVSIATVKQIQQGGPIIHTPPLWKGENVGGGAKFFKARDTANNTYQIRTVPDHYGIYSSKQGDEVHIKQRNENVGEGAPIWKPPIDDNDDPITDQDLLPDEKSKFRSLKLTSPLSSIFEWEAVEPEDKEVFLKSYGVNDTYNDRRNGSLTFVAGVLETMIQPDAGATFRLEVYETTISLVNTPPLAISVAESKVNDYWVRDGVWYAAEPADWVAAGETVVKVSYVAPTAM